jgi:hypothetical protein
MAQIVLSGSALCPSSEPESLPLLHLPFCYSLVGNLFEFRNPRDHPASLGENRQLRYNGAALAKDSWRLPQSQA